MRIRTQLLATLALLLATPLAQACDDGFNSFQSTVYAKVRRSCAGCHDGSRVDAPPFAIEDARASYNQLVNYMNFNKIEESLLVIRAGNGHCKSVACKEASGREMLDAATRWYDGGEKICERNGRLFTAEVPVPAQLPGKDQGFVTMTFDLASAKAELQGLTFQIDIQEYKPATTITRGEYRIRNPRILGGVKSIYVKDVKVLLNGKYDVIYNAYAGVDRVIPFAPVKNAKTSTPVIAATTLLMLKDSLESAKLSISFVDIELRNDEMRCENEAGYKQGVVPVMQTMNCASCHNSTGPAMGAKVFDLTAPVKDQCGVATALVDPVHFMVSPLIQVPARGDNKHPALSDAQRTEYVKALKTWLNN